MENKIDLRVLKTHNKITEALGSMMSVMTFDSITVYDLCARAGIRRATFYKHFNDKFDLLRKVVAVIIENINKKVISTIDFNNPVEYLINFTNEVIDYFDQRPAILKNLIESSAFPTLLDIIIQCTRQSLVNIFDQAKKQGVNIPISHNVIATFINSGIAGVLFEWLVNRDMSREELNQSLEHILKKFFVK